MCACLQNAMLQVCVHDCLPLCRNCLCPMVQVATGSAGRDTDEKAAASSGVEAAMNDIEMVAVDDETTEAPPVDPVRERALALATEDLANIELSHNKFEDFARRVQDRGLCSCDVSSDVPLALLSDCGQEQVGSSEKIIFCLECVTAKANVIRDMVLKAKPLSEDLPAGACERWVLLLDVGRRMEILASSLALLQVEFGRSVRTFAVQCTSAPNQTERLLPTYRIVMQSRLCQSECVPASLLCNSVRANGWEALRARCLNPKCDLRDLDLNDANDEDGKEDGQEDGAKKEIEDVDAEEVCKEELCDVQEADDDEDGDKGQAQKGDMQAAVAKQLKELYPFARPIEQGQETECAVVFVRRLP